MASPTPPAVFLSYASQDAEAARHLADALRAAGIEVWFDRSELVGGDAWDAKIRNQISECALFVPMISATTQARHEGYFRLEWRLAAQRTHMMSEQVAFLLPVVIDATRDTEADVPTEFNGVQWTRLANGEASGEFCAHVKELIDAKAANPAAARVPDQQTTRAPLAEARGRRQAALQRQPFRPWIAPAALALAAALALTLWSPWEESEAKSAAQRSAPPAAGKTATPLSEARKLVNQARELFDGVESEIEREDLALAEEFLAKAQALDATDGEVWAARADLSRDMMFAGFDLSNTRRDALRVQAERAIKLAPNSVEAQLAYCGYLMVLGGDSIAEAVRLLRPLIERAPNSHRVYRLLGLSLAIVGRLDESVAVFDRANTLPGGDPLALVAKSLALFLYGHYQQAEAAVAESLAVHPLGRARVMDTLIKLTWRGDLDGAAISLARWPRQASLEARGAVVASQVWLWRHQPDKAIDALNAFTSDAINDNLFNGPKSGLLALAHEMAGRPDAARAEWENTRSFANRLLAEDRTQPTMLAWKAIALARLGERREAEALLRQLEQTGGLRSTFWTCGATAALLRIAVDRGGDVAAKFDTEPRGSVVHLVNIPSPQGALRLNPVFDPIRAMPEFQRWIEAAPAPKRTAAAKTGVPSRPKQ